MATPNAVIENDPRTTLTPDSADALATMEADAADYFANRDAERSGAALNPVAPALEKAAAAEKVAGKGVKTPAVVPKTDGKAAPATGKVSGAPNLKAAASKTDPKAAETAANVATPEKKADPAVDFSDVPREYKPGSTRAPQWEKLHAKADHFETLATTAAAEREALRAELEQIRASGNGTASAELTQRLTALQQERDALHNQLQAVAGERIFDAESSPRRNAAFEQAKAAVGAAESARIETLLNLPESAYRDEQIEAFLATLPPLRATKLSQAVADLDRLSLERKQAASKGGEMWQRRVSEATAATQRTAAEREQAANRTFDTELKDWEVAGVTPEEADAARSVYTGKGATLQDASRAALWGAVGPRVAQQLGEAQSRIAELEGQLSKLRVAQPGIGAAGGGGDIPSTNGEEDDLNTTSYADRIAKQALRAGVRFGV